MTKNKTPRTGLQADRGAQHKNQHFKYILYLPGGKGQSHGAHLNFSKSIQFLFLVGRVQGRKRNVTCC